MNPMSNISPFAGLLPGAADLIDPERLIQSYERDEPDPFVPTQQVHFGTSGHRGSPLHRSFNRNHILAITQAICHYRARHNITGPLFLGFDTHALSQPAYQTALEVLAANGVTTMVARGREFTPTPVISHAIVTFNLGRPERFADGIVITPSHNPPEEGGFKYNPPHGGPAETETTDWIQSEANGILKSRLRGVHRIHFQQALGAHTTLQFDFLRPYVADLENVVDMAAIRRSKIRIGVDPMGGAGVHYWQPIADHYRIDLAVLNAKVDPCFRFMTRDWDGKIRMDPSSPFAMRSLVAKAGNFDISFACDTDHDRHGIVTRTGGLMPSNQFLSAALHYLLGHRPLWPASVRIGKTVVTSQMLDRVARAAGREVYETPVGFKWFVEGLARGELGFAGEESAGATFLRKDGRVWTTDKDGIIPGLLAAEITATLGKDPAVLYQDLTETLGRPAFGLRQSPASALERKTFASISRIPLGTLGGDRVERILTTAPGNGAPIGGFKWDTCHGWFAARPSGTENTLKLYAESFLGPKHLELLLNEGEAIVKKALASSGELREKSA